MKPLIRCKACGFVMAEDRPGEVCPACGVPRNLFEPYTDRVSEARRRLLSLHLHPVLVHFPQAFVFTLLVLAILGLFTPPPFRTGFLDTLRVLSWALPVVVLGAFLAGLIDGHVRFRKLTTPLLRRKIGVGALFFLLALLRLALILAYPLTAGVLGVDLVLLAAGFWCSIVLARWGTSMLESRLPG